MSYQTQDQVAEKPRNLAVGLSELESILTVLDENWNRLSSRLRPLIRQYPVAPSGESAKNVQTSSELSELIKRFSSKVQFVTNSIKEVTDNIEI